jgi:hypothetical protein
MREWILCLRASPDAWNDYLAWLGEQRQLQLERNPKTWDEEKERQGAKKMLDNILNLSTIDQKNEAQRNHLYGVPNG